jgi:hypothetical protein
MRDAKGDESIGSAFHVGEGVFVTARHVVENVVIREVRSTHALRRPLEEAVPEYTENVVKVIENAIGQVPTWPVFQNPLQITKGPFFHPDPAIDVAVFATEGLHPAGAKCTGTGRACTRSTSTGPVWAKCRGTVIPAKLRFAQLVEAPRTSGSTASIGGLVERWYCEGWSNPRAGRSSMHGVAPQCAVE